VSYEQVSEQIEQVEKLLQVAPYWFAEKKLQLIITAMEGIPSKKQGNSNINGVKP
jgi:hypothetical protein